MYVYILQSVADPDRFYIGITEDLRLRLKKHNAGEVSHTAKFLPWAIKTILPLRTERKHMLSNGI
jgi:predicted GIY-YIG superfamily endonuclease